jgi:hypothetical protein
MLSEQDQYRLNAIARSLHEDDHRFCLAVQEGRPRAPKEYRRRWASLLVLLVITVALFTTAATTGNVAALVVAVTISSAGTVILQLGSPDRPWQRPRLRGNRFRGRRRRPG